MAGGCGGCPPTKQNQGASSQPLQPRHEWDPKRRRTLSSRGWANGGGGGGAPSQGVWGMCPQNKKRGGELPTLATPPRVGPRTPANPKPAGVGQGGSRGQSPLAGGCGGCPPTNLPSYLAHRGLKLFPSPVS